VQRLVAALRHSGVKEIHLRSTAPPLRHPCSFGIDIPQEEELIAAGRSVEEIADYIGVDSLGYLSLAGLGRALSTEESSNLDDDASLTFLHNKFCYGCMRKEGWPFDPMTAQVLSPERRNKLVRVF